MNQSSAIFGALFIAYFVFITVRGELPIYAGFLLATPQGGGNTASAGNSQGANLAQSADILGNAVTALSLA